MNSKIENIKWMPVNNGSEELRKLLKLQMTKEKLISLLENINREINQTDVEWMQLKSLLKPKPQPKPVHQANINVDIKHHDIDDEAVNNIELDLSVTAPRNHSFLEEEDDDDEI